MVPLEDFKSRCQTQTVDQIVEDIFITDFAAHVSAEDIDYIKDSLCRKFRVSSSNLEIYIVGSAKLGYSISENKKRGLKRFRSFCAESDIDVAVVSRDVFRKIWEDLSIYGYGLPFFPWRSGDLSDYLLHGWLRPDKFPANSNVTRCNDWWDEFQAFSADPRFERRKVRGGLYYSVDDLRRYLQHSVQECVNGG